MLEKFEILQNLNDTQISDIEKICDTRSYQAGEAIFAEGETTDEIFFLISGQIGLYKREPETQNNIKFKEMEAGNSFGEMSFFDGSPRSCTIEAAIPNTEIWILSKQKLLTKISTGSDIFNTISQTITHQVNDLLRGLSDKHIVVLQKQIDELKERNRFAHFLFSLFLCLLLVTILNAIVNDSLVDYNVSSIQFLVGYLVIAMILPALLSFNKLDLSFQEIGITKKNTKQSIIDGVVVSLGAGVLLWIIVAIVDTIVPTLDLTAKLFQPLPLTFVLIYMAHSYLQEFVRAAVQISIQRFASELKVVYPIVMTSLIFGMVHAPFGTRPIVFAVLGSIVFGFVYQRTHNLIGVSLVHFVFGCLGISLGLI